MRNTNLSTVLETNNTPSAQNPTRHQHQRSVQLNIVNTQQTTTHKPRDSKDEAIARAIRETG